MKADREYRIAEQNMTVTVHLPPGRRVLVPQIPTEEGGRERGSGGGRGAGDR